LLDRIGTRWTSMVVKVLAEEAPDELRFAELRRRISGISQKMLSVTLQSPVRDGLVARRVEPAVHYRLTELGLSLEGPLSALRVWAETHMPGGPGLLDPEPSLQLCGRHVHRRAEVAPDPVAILVLLLRRHRSCSLRRCRDRGWCTPVPPDFSLFTSN